MKFKIILSLLMFLSVSAFAAKKPTNDMNDHKAEYSSTEGQWLVKESLGILYSEIVYGGWKVKVDKKGVKTVQVVWKNGFTEKPLKKELYNSTQYLKAGIATLVGDKVAPITDEEAQKLYDDLKLTLLLENLRIIYDKDYKQFKEEYELLSEHKIITFEKENEVLQKYGALSEWRDELIDEVSDLD